MDKPVGVYDSKKIRFEWAEAIDKPFDAQAMQEIYERYQIALRRDANWNKLYEVATKEYGDESVATHERVLAQYTDVSKSELTEITGLDPKRNTKQDMITHLAFAEGNKIENCHSRVKRMWAGMTEEEKQAA